MSTPSNAAAAPPPVIHVPTTPAFATQEIYTYQSQHPIFGLAWSNLSTTPMRLCYGSHLESLRNTVNVLSLDPNTQKLRVTGEAAHEYPCSRLMWVPQSNSSKELIASTSDCLKLWQVEEQGGITLKSRLSNAKSQEYGAPLTSFDWNETDPSLIGTSSIDTTCTIWNIETEQPKTQLIAHDKEVYDIAFARGVDIFASVGADGSVRMFDLRNLEHSTIIYETSDYTPLVRLQWNKQDPNYLATLPENSDRIIILDVRHPSLPVVELRGHTANVNSVTWAPHSATHLVSGGDDAQTLVWDMARPRPNTQAPCTPALAYRASQAVTQVSWSYCASAWVAIACGQTVQMLRV